MKNDHAIESSSVYSSCCHYNYDKTIVPLQLIQDREESGRTQTE